MKLIDETGNRYGMLTVLERAPKEYAKGAYWICRCDCGNTKSIYGSSLRAGKIKACGCRIGLPYMNGEAAFNKLYRQYKSRASISWGLTKEQAKDLTKQNCHYCGTEPKQVAYTYVGANIPYIYNGIDRIDNDKGYEPDNVVACCKVCNRAKREMPYGEFINWINRLVAHRRTFAHNPTD